MKAILWTGGLLSTSKMVAGILNYGKKYDIVAIIDNKYEGHNTKKVLGLEKDIPIVGTLEQASQFQADCFMIGVIPENCIQEINNELKEVIYEAIDYSYDVICGTYALLSDDKNIRNKASEKGVELYDVRKPPEKRRLFKGDVFNRKAEVILTVGTDWSVGKMTTALELYHSFKKRGSKVAFVATGQTGILCGVDIGFPVDNMTLEYMTGEIEHAILELDQQGYEYIIIEGQGSVSHPLGSGCAVMLLNGSQPDHIIMCHDIKREHRKSFPNFKVNTVKQNMLAIDTLLFDFKKPKLAGIAVIPSSDQKKNDDFFIQHRDLSVPIVNVKEDATVTKLSDSILYNSSESRATNV